MSTMTLHAAFHTVSDILREHQLTVSTCYAEGAIYRAMPPRAAGLTHATLRALIRRAMAAKGYAVEFRREFHEMPHSGFDIAIEFTFHADLMVVAPDLPPDEDQEQLNLL